MKQFLFLIAMLGAGTVGSLIHPFWGLPVYYVFAVLRPQHLWEWALPADIRWSLVAAGVVVLGVVANLPLVLLKSRLNLMVALLLAYALLVLLSMLVAMDPATAQAWGSEYFKIFLMAMVALVVIDELWQIRVMALGVMAAIAYIAWEVNSLYFFQGRLDIFHYGYGGLDNNGAGLVLAMGIPLAYAFALLSKRWWQFLLCVLAAFLMLHAMLMSYSRGAMVSSLVGVAWILLHHRPRFQVLIIVILLGLVVPPLAGQEIRQRFFSTSNLEDDPSIHSRFASWSAAWELAWERPLTGLGIRNSSLLSQKYGADTEGRTIHNQYLQIAADSGIPAMTIYVLMLATAIVQCHLARRMGTLADQTCGEPLGVPRDSEIEKTRAVLLGCQASLLIFATGATFLSLEVFELPWLLMVLAGAAPAAMARSLKLTHDTAATPLPRMQGIAVQA